MTLRRSGMTLVAVLVVTALIVASAMLVIAVANQGGGR